MVVNRCGNLAFQGQLGLSRKPSSEYSECIPGLESNCAGDEAARAFHAFLPSAAAIERIEIFLSKFFFYFSFSGDAEMNQMQEHVQNLEENFATGSCDFVVSDARRGRCGVQTPGLW
jgi:hypothetical protein